MGAARTIVTVGNFDGVHLGHRAILSRCVELAGDGAEVLVLAFDPHPRTVLDPEHAPTPVMPFDERARLLVEHGATRVERLEPTPELLGLSPGAFVDHVASMCSIEAFVEGPDFRFGRGRAGSMETLRELGSARGFRVEEVTPLAVALGDHTAVTASSSMTRWLLEQGRVRDAWSVLGRPHRLGGEVVRGDRRGRTLGFPTTNLETACMLPADGVYAAVATLPDGRRRGAALSVGTKPMFDGTRRVAESYIFDVSASGDAIEGLPEYGWRLELDLLGWVRDQMRFDSVERLIEQMDRDCQRVRDAVAAVSATRVDGVTVT